MHFKENDTENIVNKIINIQFFDFVVISLISEITNMIAISNIWWWHINRSEDRFVC